MNTFLPYQIKHINLNFGFKQPNIDVDNQGGYFVFWWQQIPLGEVFLEPGRKINEEEYKKVFTKAIAPAINFYEKQHSIASKSWGQFIADDKLEQFNEWMNEIMSPWIVSDLPVSVPVSIVICTRDRPTHLHNCLKMLDQLGCKAQEVIVVDNAPPSQATKQVADKFAGVKYVVEPRGGLDIARNAGVRNSCCSIIAFVDDDVVVHPLFAYNTWQTFQNATVASMTGLVIASKLDTEAQYIFEKHWSFNRGYVDVIYDNNFFDSKLSEGPPVWEIGAGANMAFRKSIFETAGYFDELLDAGAAGCNGDSEMWFRILLNGGCIVYNPRVIAYHEHRSEMSALQKQIFYYMRGFTVAALFQQQQAPQAGYRRKLKSFPKYFLKMVLKGFPFYNDRYKTVFAEIRGVASGLPFYLKHRQK